jgi:hypothetical protein
MVAELATPTSARASSCRLLNPSGKARTNVSKCNPFMIAFVTFLDASEP